MISAVILAGGYSSRMHSNKAELILKGKRLIDLQIEKMRSLGVQDIVISGYDQKIEGTHYVQDIYPHRGPLSGIHAGLKQIENDTCFVISVDAPLVPQEFLMKLAQSHTHGACIAECEGHYEPLIGVYEKCMADTAEELLQGEDTSVRALFRKAGMTTVVYEGDPFLLGNCNTPEEYQAFLAYTEKQ